MLGPPGERNRLFHDHVKADVIDQLPPVVYIGKTICFGNIGYGCNKVNARNGDHMFFLIVQDHFLPVHAFVLRSRQVVWWLK